MLPALKSMLATVQASESILTTAGLNAGERALPLFNESRLRSNSLVNLERSIE
jgi:hypothetical protein